MSSLHKRSLKSGDVWYGKVKQRDGSWKNFCTQCKTKREAKETIAKIESEIAAGRDPFNTERNIGILLQDAQTAFLTDRTAYVAPKTLEAYRDTFRLVSRVLGAVSVTDIGAGEIGQIRLALAHMRPDSQNHYLRHCKAFLNWCARQEDFKDYKPPKIELVRTRGQGHPDYYSVEECGRILAAAQSTAIKGVSFQAFLLTLLLTGMRLGEACKLRRQWVDRDRGIALLPSEATKTNRSRAVPLPPLLTQVLGDLPQVHDSLFFPFSETSGYLRDVWRSVTVRAKVRYLKLHNLRDTHIVHSIMSGEPAFMVAKRVGNSVAVIERHYTAFMPEALQSSMRASLFATNMLPERDKQLINNLAEHNS